MFITNSKHKDFKIINSKNNNKFILRLFNFEFYNKNDTRLLSFSDWISIYFNKNFSFILKKNRERWKIVNGLYKRYTLI